MPHLHHHELHGRRDRQGKGTREANKKVDRLRPTAHITITLATTKNSPTIKDEIFSLCTEIHHTSAI